MDDSRRDPPNRNNFPQFVFQAHHARLAAKVSLAIMMLLLARHNMVSRKEEAVTENATIDTTDMVEDTVENRNNTTEDSDVKNRGDEVIVRKVVVVQPSCSRAHILVMLDTICKELIVKNDLCTPEDIYNHKKHQIPKIDLRNRSNKEPQVPAIVNFFVGFVLLSSLFAAFLEVYRARRAAASGAAGDGHHTTSRKCSLAELTILKHQRKEMARRESLAPGPAAAGSQQSREDAVARLITDYRPSPPLQRCSSFPLPSPSSLTAAASFDFAMPTIPESGRESTDGARRPSIVVESGRRQSVVPLDSHGRQPSMESRRMSVVGGSEGSPQPERRHHSRLVHRLH